MLIVVAFGVALLVKTFLIQAFYIPSGSMLPTLQTDDRVLVNKLAYRFREPRRGEVIVFVHERARRGGLIDRIVSFLTEGLGARRPEEEDRIKRIVGLPGETIEMREGVVSITRPDGSRLTLEEPYLIDVPDTRPFGPQAVPNDSYFVMGDNRPNSDDSRFAGPVRRSQIIGKAFVKVWPLRRVGLIDEPAFAGASIVSLALLERASRGRARRRFDILVAEAAGGRRGPGEVRSRDGARAVPRVPRRAAHVPVSRRDGAPLLPREQGRS